MSPMSNRISLRAAAFAVLGLLAAGALPLGSGPAWGQGAPANCRARDGLLSQLEKKYGEVPVAIGVTSGVAGGALVELLTAKDGLTWTLILTTPKGLSCLIASGEGWRSLAPAPSGPSV